MNTKILKKLGENIKNIRKEKGYTQEYLAEKISVHPTYIGKIESGKSNPSTILLFKLSRALSVTIPTLFKFDE